MPPLPWITTALKSLLALAIATASLASLVSIQRSQLSQTLQTDTQALQRADRQEALRLSLLGRMPSFGFDNLLSDWTFLNFLQYDGDTIARRKLGYELAPAYFDVMTRRDPRFVDTYLFLSGTLAYRMAKPELAVEYMTRGTNALSPQQHPRAFVVWRFKGLEQLLLLGDIPASIHSHQKAGEWAAGSSDPQYHQISPLLLGTARFLAAEPDSKRVRVWSWSDVYAQAQAARDRETQERAKQEILNLGGVEKTDPQRQTYFEFPEPQPSPTPTPSPQASPDS
ncbi:MAG: hypothetical protein VKJ24_11960 [Synechococcales bacterium]|nr:hypothetical protein [Synechococcales bacterium]